MGNATKLPVPVLRALRKLGQDISDARRRRRITMELVAERAGIARATLTKIEKGSSTVSMASYAMVLFVLGMIERLYELIDANYDLVGRSLEEENLPKRVRLPRKSKKHTGDNNE